MRFKIKFLLSFLLLIILTPFVSAYHINFVLDRSGWNYAQYYCGPSDPDCYSPSYIGGGYEDKTLDYFFTTLGIFCTGSAAG